MASDDLLTELSDTVAWDWQWGWQRGLIAPRPSSTTAELARWFAPDGRSAEDSLRGVPAEGWETALVGWQPAADPLRFLVVPRSLALLLGSLTAIVLGFVAVRIKPAWRVAGSMIVLALSILLAIARPQMLALLVYAAEPGLIVLAVALAANWAAQRRYRRRVLFLPTFASVKEPHAEDAGGSAIRNGAANRVPPGTHDDRRAVPAGRSSRRGVVNP